MVSVTADDVSSRCTIHLMAFVLWREALPPDSAPSPVWLVAGDAKEPESIEPGPSPTIHCVVGQNDGQRLDFADCCMVGTITTINSKQVIKKLEAQGWYLARVKGSHHQFKHPDKPGLVTVKHPDGDVPKGTLASIERQAGWR